MQVLPRQCCSKPPFLARPILSPARSDAAMGFGLATSQELRGNPDKGCDTARHVR
jgi:hypothetical protein